MYDFKYFQTMMNMPGHGNSGQERLRDSRVLIIGAGGLGCPVATGLAYSGIGYIKIIDFDKIEPNNLNRQFLYQHKDVGAFKAHKAQERLANALPGVIVEADIKQVEKADLNGYDLIVDCTDSINIKQNLPSLCSECLTPLVSGAIYRRSAQIITYPCDKHDKEILTSYYKGKVKSELTPACSMVGVYGTHCMLTGAIMAAEVLSYLLSGHNLSTEKLIYLDSSTLSIEIITLGKLLVTKDTEENINNNSLNDNTTSITLKKAIDNNYTIIDVRDKSEFLENPSSYINIPLDEIIENCRILPTGKIAFICKSGKRARLASKHTNYFFNNYETRYIAQ